MREIQSFRYIQIQTILTMIWIDNYYFIIGDGIGEALIA